MNLLRRACKTQQAHIVRHGISVLRLFYIIDFLHTPTHKSDIHKSALRTLAVVRRYGTNGLSAVSDLAQTGLCFSCFAPGHDHVEGKGTESWSQSLLFSCASLSYGQHVISGLG